MKKKFLIVGFLIIIAAVPFYMVNGASSGVCNSNSDPGCAVKSTDDVLRIFTSIFNFLYDIFLITAIIMILLAAFNYLTAKDDAKKIESAHSRIMWALIAIAIALSSMGAVKLVQSFISSI